MILLGMRFVGHLGALGSGALMVHRSKSLECTLCSARVLYRIVHMAKSLGHDKVISYALLFKAPAVLYVLRMIPDGIALVLTSSNVRGGVPSANRRLPVPNKTG